MVKGIKKIRTPGNKLNVHKISIKKSKARCSLCGTFLFVNLKKKSLSTKRPTRPYAGKVCHNCIKSIIQVSEI